MIYRVLAEVGGAVVQPWRPLADASWTGARWQGQAALPDGGPYRIEVGFTDAGGITHVGRSGSIAIGICVIYWGQSNARGRANQAATVGADNAPIDYGGDDQVYSLTNAQQWVGDRGGVKGSQTCAAALARTLSIATGLPVGVVGAGVTGQLIESITPDQPNWSELEARLAAAGGEAEALIFDQGEADGFIFPPRPLDPYAGHFAAIVAGARALTGRPQLPVLVSITGRSSVSGPNDAQSTALAAGLRARQLGLVDPADRIWIAAHRVGTPLVDGIHCTSGGYQEACRRDALSLAHHVYGVSAYDGRGPLATGVARTGAALRVAIDLNGAIALEGGAVSGFEVSADDFATLLPLAEARVDGAGLLLTLAAAPASPVAVRSHAPRNYDDSAVAAGRYADGTAIPLFPILVPLVAA